MKSILSTVFLLHLAIFLSAQKTQVWQDPSLKFKEAVQAFSREDFSQACPQFRQLRRSGEEAAPSNGSISQTAIDFYAIVCGLLQDESLAEKEALQFIKSCPQQPLKDRMFYYLGDYYFNHQQWSLSLEQFSGAGIANLSNAEIASTQFRQGYSYFALQRYKEAAPLLNSIRSINNDPNQVPATYYYGLLSFREKKWEEALRCFQQVVNDNRYAGIVPYYIAQIMLMRGEQDEVVSYLEKTLRNQQIQQVHFAEMKQLLGHTYFTKKNYSKALPLLRDYAKANDSIGRQDIYELSYAAYQEGLLNEAVTGFKKLSESSDSLGQHAMYLLGDAYLRLGDKQGARNAFLFCVLNNSNPDLKENAQFFHAKLSYELGYFNEALKGFQQFIASYPNSAFYQEANELYIGVLAATSNYREALSLIDKMPAPPAKVNRLLPVILYGRAAELIYDNQLAAASSLLDRAFLLIDNISVLPFLHFWKGELSFRKGEYSLALQHSQSYIELGAPTAGEANLPHARYTMGYSYMRLNQFSQALPHWEWLVSKAGTVSPSIAQDVIVRLADCQFMLRSYTAAKSNYEKVVQRGAQSADYAMFQLAAIAGIRNPAEKISLLNELGKRYPASALLAASWMAIADTYMADEKYREALPYLDRIINSSDENSQLPEAYFKAGLAYYNSDNNPKAMERFQQLVEKYPHALEAEDAIDNIKEIYIEMGRSVDYIGYMQKLGRPLNVNTRDSITYIAAEQLYTEKQGNAAAALTAYIEQFPQGTYLLDARYLLADIKTSAKDWQSASELYDTLVAMSPNRYAEQAALRAGRIYFFELKNYNKAASTYQKLAVLTSQSENKLEALRGALRSYYQLRDWDAAVSMGDLLLLEKNCSADDRTIAAMSKAKQLLLKGATTEAQHQFKIVIQQNKAELAAEARFEIAALLFKQQQWKAAEKAAFETINRSGSYEEWVTRSYLLLGDIFMAQQDYFNARATYRSVYENATREEWKKEAIQKLDELKKLDKETSIKD